jgi:hypothetical protein
MYPTSVMRSWNASSSLAVDVAIRYEDTSWSEDSGDGEENLPGCGELICSSKQLCPRLAEEPDDGTKI